MRLDQPDSSRVLVVLNEPTLRLGFAYALSNPSMLVDVAATGHETLERMENGDYDLLVLELRMPGIDGIEVIETLRSRGDHTPVILCTAMHRPNATLRAIRLGVVDYLVKPVIPAEVRRIVEFVLHPGTDPFSKAMTAARIGKWNEAIRLLEILQAPEPTEHHWLKVLTLIRGSPPCDDESDLDAQVRAAFPFLAWSASEAQ